MNNKEQVKAQLKVLGRNLVESVLVNRLCIFARQSPVLPIRVVAIFVQTAYLGANVYRSIRGAQGKPVAYDYTKWFGYERQCIYNVKEKVTGSFMWA